MPADTTEMGPTSARIHRLKSRLRTIESLDRRTAAGKRAAELIQTFEAAIGGNLSAAQRVAVHRAATLVALSQDASVRRLGGDLTISLEDITRLDSAANRATRALGIVPGAKPAGPANLREYLAIRSATTAPGQSGPPMPDKAVP